MKFSKCLISLTVLAVAIAEGEVVPPKMPKVKVEDDWNTDVEIIGLLKKVLMKFQEKWKTDLVDTPLESVESEATKNTSRAADNITLKANSITDTNVMVAVPNTSSSVEQKLASILTSPLLHTSTGTATLSTNHSAETTEEESLTSITSSTTEFTITPSTTQSTTEAANKLQACPIAWPYHDPWPVSGTVCLTNNDCASGELCCSLFNNLHCVKAVDATPHAGQCPKLFLPRMRPQCLEDYVGCQFDSECGSAGKCCPGMCSYKECKAPALVSIITKN